MKIEHQHEHHEKATGNLIFVFILNITFNVIVILGGLITNSVAILADCLHDLSDTISIGLAGVLEHVSQKNPNENYTYGYQRFFYFMSSHNFNFCDYCFCCCSL